MYRRRGWKPSACSWNRRKTAESTPVCAKELASGTHPSTLFLCVSRAEPTEKVFEQSRSHPPTSTYRSIAAALNGLILPQPIYIYCHSFARCRMRPAEAVSASGLLLRLSRRVSGCMVNTTRLPCLHFSKTRNSSSSSSHSPCRKFANQLSPPNDKITKQRNQALSAPLTLQLVTAESGRSVGGGVRIIVDVQGSKPRRPEINSPTAESRRWRLPHKVRRKTCRYEQDKFVS